MRISRFVLALFLLALLAAGLHADDFSLNPVLVRRVAGQLFVSTKGTPPPLSDLKDRNHWVVTAKAPGAGTTSIPVELQGSPQWSATSSTLTLNYVPPPGLGSANPRTWTWKVTYTGPGGISASSAAASGTFFSGARSKTDADIYVSGTLLAGEGTKPIYTLDSRIGWVPEWKDSGIYAGVESTVTINSSAKPPVNRTQTDPDSITADATIHFSKSDWIFSIYPLKGEFSRRSPDSNFVPAATVQWAPIKNVGARGAIAFYPSVGVEGGRNLDKPSTIDGQAVNLNSYNGIFRGVLGAFAAYYVRARKPDPGNPYQFEITSTFVDRVLSTAEPFLTTSVVNGKSATKVNFGTNPRQYVETDLTWNITPLLGLTVKDTWGSLPPLFALTGQQVTIGLTFRAKLPGHH
jgi:hypothetical protein